MAGLAETCSHVAALLFLIEARVRLEEQRTVTGQPAYWKPPCSSTSAAKIAKQPARTAEIVFTAPKTQRKIMFGAEAVKAPASRTTTKVHSKEDQLAFLEKLSSCKDKVAVLALVPPFAGAFVKNSDLPHPLTSLKKDIRYTSLEELLKYCHCLDIKVTAEQALAVERETPGQKSSKLWFRQREGRVTASKLYNVCNTNVNHLSLSSLKSIICPNAFTSKSTSWGSEHENCAKSAYRAQMITSHHKFECLPCGLFISPQHPFLAETPDGLITCACCFGRGCLEIKCPYSARNLSVREAVSTIRKFCLVEMNDEISLSKDHSYYYQVQCQLFVSGCDYADFCHWTLKDVFVQRLYLDDFIAQSITVSSLFFRNAVLPEMIGSYFSLKESSSNAGTAPVSTISSSTPVYCQCRQPEYGRMNQCEGADCRGEWFHFDCVNLNRAPRGKWLCSSWKPTDIKRKGVKRHADSE